MSQVQDRCIDDESLQQLLLGMVSQEQAVRLEEHVLGCRRCGDRLAEIRAEDTLVEAARGQATLSNCADKQLQRLMDQLCHLPMPTLDMHSRNAHVECVDELWSYLGPAESEDELGRIGTYRVLGILGEGGMGIVMQAEDTQLGRRVAMKVMKPMLAASPVAKARFLREARAAAAIQHDNVVTIHQVGEHAGLPYLAMPLLAGQSLRQRLAEVGKLSPSETVGIGGAIAQGLAAAHARDVVHRDIKPDNIWLEAGSDRVKILDFGLAHVADDLPRLTQSGTVTGTPAYMAPEQVDHAAIDPRADLFSLGCVLYECCTGRQAFGRPTIAASLMAVVQHAPPAPRQLNAEVPRPLSDLVMKLLEKDPVRRPPDAVAVQAALANCATEPKSAAAKIGRGKAISVLLALGFFAVIAATILYVKTGAGTLILDVVEPDVQVTIDGANVALRSPRDQIDVRVGKHDLSVSKDGFKTVTQSFEIVRNGTVEVSVRLEANSTPPAPPRATSAPAPSAIAMAAKENAAPMPPTPAAVSIVTTQHELGPSPGMPHALALAGPVDVKLPSHFAHFCTGGAGRYLIFDCKDAGQVVIVNAVEARIVHRLEFPGQDLLIAANAEKLLVAAPTQKLLHRYSLQTFQREKSAPIPFDGPLRTMLMGSASNGPTALWSDGNIVLWDVEQMKPFAVDGDVLGGSTMYGFELRTSADGLTFAGWTSGLSGQPFHVMTLSGHTSSVAGTPEGFSMNGRWAQPNADASLIFHFGGIYTCDLKPIAAGSLDGAALLPTEDARFFLAYRGQANAPPGKGSQVSICTTADRRPIATVKNLENITGGTIPPAWGYVGAEARIRYLPGAGRIVVVPDSNDRAIVRRFDLVEALRQSGEDYLVVISEPPAWVRAGDSLNYQLDILSKSPDVRYRLETAPLGMTLSASGLLHWDVPAQYESASAKVMIALGSGTGGELFHSFEVQVDPVKPEER